MLHHCFEPKKCRLNPELTQQQGLELRTKTSSGFAAQPGRRLTAVLAVWLMGLALILPARGQELVEVIPMTQERRPYFHYTEDGTGIVCGAELIGSFPVYKSHTNINSYSLNITGLNGWSGIRRWIEREPAVGGRFEFVATFTGRAGGATPAPDCGKYMQAWADLPPWTATIQRQPPRASFTSTPQVSDPGVWNFQSTSTDPEEQALTEQWVFGDGGTGGGQGEVHRYTLPGNFAARLTVTDTDGLTNRASKTIVVPAPKLAVSLRIFSKHENARIETAEVFRVRATVSASSDGVGDLSNVAFTGAPLTVPSNLTVVEVPPDTVIGTLQPGTEKVFEWTLKAKALGDFDLLTSSLTGKDAAGKAVNAVRATASGTVTALIAGIEQRPKRIVLGEDNNGDGVVNAADARVEVILGVTNVAAVAVTEVHTDNVDEPIRLVNKLAEFAVSLVPINVFFGELGSIQPGAANAVFRTNVYEATNYVFAAATSIVRGKVEDLEAQTGAEGLVKVQAPGVEITMHSLDETGLTGESVKKGEKSIDAPLVPVESGDSLDAQKEVYSGLIGDGVTPLLFVLKGDTKALAVQNEELKIQLIAEVKSGGKLLGLELQKRLRILKNGAWTASDTAVMTQAEPKVYAYLTPIESDEIEPQAGSGMLQASLLVRNADSQVEIEKLEFGLRKPPIALVHGYNTDGNWGSDFEAILNASRPVDSRSGISFVKVIHYGQRVEAQGILVDRVADVSLNTAWPLDALAPLLGAEFERAMKPLKEFWAFTRHDVVAHSQGGLLTRMLSSQNSNHSLEKPFRNENNLYRGRFHRVVTIGSPHNGTRILRYMLRMTDAGVPWGTLVPRLASEVLAFTRVAQEKFDPWGLQIFNLNSRVPTSPWYPDQDARFHLVQTTVNDGKAPSATDATWAEYALGLNWDLVGQNVIPRGSDGVVDFDAEGAVAPGDSVPANVFTLPNSFQVSHATTGAGPIDDIFEGTDGGQVNAVVVAKHAIQALDQEGIPGQQRVFGRFQVPQRLPDSIREAVDAAAEAQNNILNLDDLAAIENAGEGGLNGRPRPAGDGPKTFSLKLKPSATRGVGSVGVLWAAELFGTNGISTAGLTLVPDPADPTRATLHVDDGVLGDVVAYALYPSVTGSTVYSKPIRVASFEPATPAVELRVLPQGQSMPVGGAVPIKLFVRHADGLWIQRHVKADEITVTSQAPLVVSVEDPLHWRCLSAGKAVVTVNWRGLTKADEVTLFGYRPGNLPVPNPLVWLRSDAGLNLEGTNVVSWTDQSGNGFEFSALTVATRPKWVTNVVNGLPSVRFAASRLTGNLDRTLTNATLFTLCRFTAAPGGSTYLYAFGTRNFSGLTMSLARRNGNAAYHYDGAAERLAPNTIAGSQFQIFSQVYGEGGADRHRLERNLETLLDTRTTTGRAYSAIATNVFLGSFTSSGFFFPGDLVEWLIYDRALNVEERYEVEEYLRQRAGLAPFLAEGSLDLSTGSIVDFNPSALPEADWTSDSAKRAVTLPVAGDPSFLLAPEAPVGEVIHARLRSNDDEGFLGFVIGLKDRGNFLLFDWNRAPTNHPDFGLAAAGMRLRSFHLPPGEDPTGTDFWSSPDPGRVTPLANIATPWVSGVDYDLTIRFLPDRLELVVQQGVTTLVSWSLPELGKVTGRFGFYANAAPGIRFGQLTMPGAPLHVSGLHPENDTEATITWMNGKPPYVIEASTSLKEGEWFEVSPATPNTSRRVTFPGTPVFLRVRGAGN